LACLRLLQPRHFQLFYHIVECSNLGFEFSKESLCSILEWRGRLKLRPHRVSLQHLVYQQFLIFAMLGGIRSFLGCYGRIRTGVQVGDVGESC